jgi:Leucine Rich repeat
VRSSNIYHFGEAAKHAPRTTTTMGDYFPDYEDDAILLHRPLGSGTQELDVFDDAEIPAVSVRGTPDRPERSTTADGENLEGFSEDLAGRLTEITVEAVDESQYDLRQIAVDENLDLGDIVDIDLWIAEFFRNPGDAGDIVEESQESIRKVSADIENFNHLTVTFDEDDPDGDRGAPTPNIPDDNLENRASDLDWINEAFAVDTAAAVDESRDLARQGHANVGENGPVLTGTGQPVRDGAPVPDNPHVAFIRQDQETLLLMNSARLREPGSVQRLAHELEHSSHVTTVSLLGCQLRNGGTTTIAMALCRNGTLQRLSMGSNEIGDPGARSLAEAIQVNGTLTVLSLVENLIGDSGATSLARAIQVNSALSTLYLDGNDIGDPGVEALAEAVEANDSLTLLSVKGNRITAAGIARLQQAQRSRALRGAPAIGIIIS